MNGPDRVNGPDPVNGPVPGSRLAQVRAVADAVLYEGYLLYPYRSTSAKNQLRWQFGVLGPPSASSHGTGEEPDLALQCLLAPDPPVAVQSVPVQSVPVQSVPDQPVPGPHPAAPGPPTVRVLLRFLQLQARRIERIADADRRRFVAVPELRVAGRTWLSWDEAVERELEFGPFEAVPGCTYLEPVEVPGGSDVDLLSDAAGSVQGRVVRRRRPLTAVLTLTVEPAGDQQARGLRLRVGVRNVTTGRFASRDEASAASFLGAHLILVADGGAFVSVIDPPDWALAAAAGCVQHRCWPVLAGPAGETGIVLGSPIILYDYPALAPESAGALFDSTEIDEILTLRVMTMTDEEKAAARATDPQAAAIIDRCDRLSPEDLQRLHGVQRLPAGSTPPDPARSDAARSDAARPDPAGLDPPGPADDDRPWWDPGADASVAPATDVVLVQGVAVRRGSLVRLRPGRRADAQDLFYAGQSARVTAVVSDVDGQTHVAVVLVDDPAADLHEWYGRYLYFSPDELEPLEPKESRS